MKRLMLAALAFGLLSTTANAVVLYDPHNRVVPVTGHWVNHGNRTTHFNQYGAFIGTSIRRGNVSTLYNPNGKFAGTRSLRKIADVFGGRCDGDHKIAGYRAPARSFLDRLL